jgi:hypothetical protein
MYFLAEGRTVPNNNKPIRLGYPVPQDMSPDICICTEATPYIYIALNANILREALLTNPKLTEKLLGLTVTAAEAPSYEAPVAETSEDTAEAEASETEEKPKKRGRGAKA